ncbi:hypothetical protein EIP91_004431 [Steccherinum ochraceum]|uniref:Uncharacterized protein n=1 Tax=Steccherinum ochraceum TaxID=92696 RepID=A0A4R0RK80_9APHY|nr:hypothetical protein EIP91_004431 [Steccherinum ochraceum]
MGPSFVWGRNPRFTCVTSLGVGASICKGEIISADIFLSLGFLGTAAFSALRIWAIWGHAVMPTLTVLLVAATVPIVNILRNPFLNRMESVRCPAGSLWVKIDAQLLDRYDVLISTVAFAARSAAILSDGVVLALTWMKTADIWRTSLKIKGLKPSLTMLLLRDGTVYFGMLFIMNVVVPILDSVQNESNGSSSFLFVVNAVCANLVARFILDLRSVFSKGTVHAVSSIRFAGNMGAPLGIDNSTWISCASEDVTDGSQELYVEAAIPFRAGLELEVEEISLQGGPIDVVAPDTCPVAGISTIGSFEQATRAITGIRDGGVDCSNIQVVGHRGNMV